MSRPASTPPGLRIIAGSWRGRRIPSPVAADVRPTTDRVREALFSMLAARFGSLEGLTVADLFAGSGALGLEALSRGAARAIFVDSNRGAGQAIARTLAAFDATARGTVLTAPADRLPPRDTPVDLVLMDPPYGKGLVVPVLAALAEAGWVGPHSWASVETPREEAVDAAGWDVVHSASYGKSRISLLRPVAADGSC
ncbi:16S rRNA (guanine(966)-N(2))-methyltransferase RsmD [Parapedomonas caeni]